MTDDQELEQTRRALRTAVETCQRLEEGIRPFVDFADTIKSTPPGPFMMDDHVLLSRTSLNSGAERRLTAGDFRSAYALSMGAGYLASRKLELVRATVAEIRRLAQGSNFKLDDDAEWKVLQTVLGDGT